MVTAPPSVAPPDASASLTPSHAAPTTTEVQKPKRPLSAYNLFFRYERARLLVLKKSDKIDDEAKTTPSSNPTPAEIRSLLSDHPHCIDKTKRRKHRKSHGAVSFKELTDIVARNWKKLDAKSKESFRIIADEGRAQYGREMEEYIRRTTKRMSEGEEGEEDYGGPQQKKARTTMATTSSSAIMQPMQTQQQTQQTQQQQQQQQRTNLIAASSSSSLSSSSFAFAFERSYERSLTSMKGSVADIIASAMPTLPRSQTLSSSSLCTTPPPMPFFRATPPPTSAYGSSYGRAASSTFQQAAVVVTPGPSSPAIPPDMREATTAIAIRDRIHCEPSSSSLFPPSLEDPSSLSHVEWLSPPLRPVDMARREGAVDSVNDEFSSLRRTSSSSSSSSSRSSFSSSSSSYSGDSCHSYAIDSKEGEQQELVDFMRGFDWSRA